MKVEEREKEVSLRIAPGQWSIVLADSCSVDSSCLTPTVHEFIDAVLLDHLRQSLRLRHEMNTAEFVCWCA